MVPDEHSIKIGDRVRITYEGEVNYTGSDGLNIKDGRAHWFDEISNIEVLAPERFKPGDVVRSKIRPEELFTITTNGYVNHSTGFVFVVDYPFFSDNFEKIDLTIH